ncbi:replication-associated recombination protein A [Psychroflexus maritimus]|uniref:Replication-associated recombination protein A n=1 Tax=Psychroflexus maritimus TaxID=2714865 RepID=A0A967ADV0_9FLAO|nr:replication-associated recombination protein A [Psychroflexus maritimus]NGZ90452.1 replication-associated recombination protein A [Psychroflexus maritimus]
MNQPLAERIRPKKLSEYIGQKHLVGQNGPIQQALHSGGLPSMIFWGPPGVGKTSLAQLIAEESKRTFYTLSAISSGVKDVREVIEKAKQSGGMFSAGNPILFIDEIHRFSKSQQDSLLGAVEKGWVCLIGATTENPSFEVIPALLSRCQTYVLKEFDKKDLLQLLAQAMQKDSQLQKKDIKLTETEALLRFSGGDARKLLNIFELLIQSQATDDVEITNTLVEQQIQQKPSKYDKTGEQHYDIISAFIKSIRGSDPNAAVYWLARMIEGGEDLKFIARRLIILASEDIGLANPTALVMANNAFQAVNSVGYPESRIILSQCCIYLATSPKSNAAYMAINQAQQEVRNSGDLSVPLAIRNAPTKLMKDLDYGKDYKYAHNYSGSFVQADFLPKEIEGKIFFKPNNNKREQAIATDLKAKWKGKYNY